jgi:hypothetical protein
MRSLYKVRDKRRFLVAALTELAGTAEVSFEGDLHMTTLFDVAGASSDETKVLKRGTLSPKQDFVVLPLESKTVGPIMAAVGGTVPRGIIHLQVQKEGCSRVYVFRSSPDINVHSDTERCRNSDAVDRTLMPAKSRYR